MLPRPFLILISLLAALLAGAGAAAQTTITLRPVAKLAEGAQVLRLADIAELSGPDAERLGALVVVHDPQPGRDGVVRVDVGQVREALEDGAAVNWGKVTLRGARCAVRMGRAEAEPTPAVESRRPEKGRNTQPSPVDLSGPPTVRTAVAAKLVGLYGVDPERLRLGFDPSDAGVLDATTAGRVVDIDPSGAAGSARLPVRVTLYSGQSLVLAHTLQVDVLVQRGVVLAATNIERGRTIEPADLRVEERWEPPSTGGALRIEDAAGGIAERRIAAGRPVLRDDVAAPLACKRGDTVYVHCLSGTVIVKMKARAMGSARDGELVQLRAEGSDEPFTARMSGRGRAVLTVTPGDPTRSVFGGEVKDEAPARRGRERRNGGSK